MVDYLTSSYAGKVLAPAEESDEVCKMCSNAKDPQINKDSRSESDESTDHHDP